MEHKTEALIERLLLEQGRYDPLEFLFAEAWLDYADYEAWRKQGKGLLEDALRGDHALIFYTLEHATTYACNRGLAADIQDYPSRDPLGSRRLRCAKDVDRDALLRTRYQRREDVTQLDLFMDTGGTMLFNDVLQALILHDHKAASRYLQELRELDADHSRLGDLQRLVEAAAAEQTPVLDVGTELQVIELQISPLASNLLGVDARGYLYPLWQRINHALRGQPFDPHRPQQHCSWVRECMGDWQGVIDALNNEVDWEQQPLLIATHARANQRLHQPLEGLANWFLLCWRFPDHTARLAQEADSEWRELWIQFEGLENELAIEDFPAWLLIQRPGLSAHLEAKYLSAAPPAWHKVVVLLKDGGKDISKRKELQDCNPALFACYLTRQS